MGIKTALDIIWADHEWYIRLASEENAKSIVIDSIRKDTIWVYPFMINIHDDRADYLYNRAHFELLERIQKVFRRKVGVHIDSVTGECIVDNLIVLYSSTTLKRSTTRVYNA